ncbi:hypothetical protein GCM10022226_32840 [Sphaerisporangium flaviroseum]|uniref:Uncharacterized protein n=1 Tax=Sphaerisporangium flaviroseum TaxID=509199 RepID=A0ABP7I202_9ACTN
MEPPPPPDPLTDPLAETPHRTPPVMVRMNNERLGTNKNRAAEICFLIKALEKMK